MFRGFTKLKVLAEAAAGVATSLGASYRLNEFEAGFCALASCGLYSSVTGVSLNLLLLTL